METLKPLLVEALADVCCQVPPALAAAGRPAWVKFDARRCKECGWSGHEGQLGKDRTIMGDGWVPSFCPACGAGGVTLFGDRTIERLKGHSVELEIAFEHEQRFGKWGLWPVEPATVD